MIDKIRNRQKMEEARIAFALCGGKTYQLIKSRDEGDIGEFFDESYVRIVLDLGVNVYVEGGIGE